MLEAELYNKAHISVHQEDPNLEQGWTDREGGTHSGSENGETGGSGVAWRPNVVSGRPRIDRVGSPSGTTRVRSGSLGGKVRTASEVVGEDSPCAERPGGMVAASLLCSAEGEFLVENSAARTDFGIRQEP